MRKFLVYYPSFPTYRAAILQGLASSETIQFDFISGTNARHGITPIAPGVVPRHVIVESSAIRAASYDHGVLKRFHQGDYDGIVVAPALASLTVWSIVVWARLRRRRVYLWGQCGKPGESGIKRLLKEALNRLATGLLVYGRSEAEAALKYGIASKRVHIVRNSIAFSTAPSPSDLAISAPLDEALSDVSILEGCEEVLLFVGRLTPEKRLDLLLLAAHRLHDEGINVGMLVIGDGPETDRLKEAAELAAIPLVMPGSVHSEHYLSRLYSYATVAVSPGEVGLFALQAISFGLRIVAPNDSRRNGPEVETIIPGVTGMLFTPGNINELVVAIKQVWTISSGPIDDSIVSEITSQWSPGTVVHHIERALSRR